MTELRIDGGAVGGSPSGNLLRYLLQRVKVGDRVTVTPFMVRDDGDAAAKKLGEICNHGHRDNAALRTMHISFPTAR